MLGRDPLEDLRWLLSDEGRALLERYAATGPEGRSSAMRKRLPRGRAESIHEMLELRRRAASKLEGAERLWFTRRALEQASGTLVARWKAKRFPPDGVVADLCCGVGGDLRELARRAGRVVGVDHDLRLCWMAHANLEVDRDADMMPGEFAVVRADVVAFSVESCTAWHIDPDRRVGSRRTVSLERMLPGRTALESLWGQCPSGAVKLAPATRLPASWNVSCERCWISARGECKEQVLFRGDLAVHPGCRVAVRIGSDGKAEELAVGERELQGMKEPPLADRIGDSFYEAEPSLLASGLAPLVAARHGLNRVTRGAGHVTGDGVDTGSWMQRYEVLHVLPLDQRRIRKAVRREGLRITAVKQRGMKLDVARWQRDLTIDADRPAVLIATRLRDRPIAVLATPANGAG